MAGADDPHEPLDHEVDAVERERRRREPEPEPEAERGRPDEDFVRRELRRHDEQLAPPDDR